MRSHAENNAEVLSQFTQQAESYARLFGSMKLEMAEEFRAIVGPPGEPHDVLEVACGPGTLALDLAAVANSVTGIDLTPAMLDEARAAQARRGIANARWVEGDGAALPFADGSFSLVVCRAAFHHFVAPERVLGEMARVCRSGGRVAVGDVTPPSINAAAYDRLERMRDSSHAHALPLAELRALATDLPLTEAAIRSRTSEGIPFDAVLKTSFPVGHTIEQVREVVAEDAETGADALGLNARVKGDVLLVDYPMSLVVWTRD